MPNWCTTNYAFYTNPDNISELQRLHKRIVKVITSENVPTNFYGNGWLGHIAKEHGYDSNAVNCSGEIYLMSKLRKGQSSFLLETLTAWCPATELWEGVCSQYENILFEYCAEEPGMGLFTNTDTDGLFFGERFFTERQASANLKAINTQKRIEQLVKVRTN